MAMEYFILKPDGEQTGTYSLEQIRSMLSTGFIGQDTLYWHEGITEWQPVDRIEESVNFAPLLSRAKTAPPPVLRWSGSLLRAIPSPYQKPPPAAKTAHSPLSAKAEKRAAAKPFIHDVLPTIEEVQSPIVNGETVAVPETRAEMTASIAPEPAVVVRQRPVRLTGYFVIAAALILVALALGGLAWVAKVIKDAPLSRVTFSGQNVYVLKEQSAIKAFEDDVQNSPQITDLKRQIDQATDPVSLQRLSIALQKESTRHPDDVTQEYIQQNKAEYVEPGTYHVLAYFDDNGDLILPHEGEGWVAIKYKDSIVYAHKGIGALPESSQ